MSYKLQHTNTTTTQTIAVQLYPPNIPYRSIPIKQQHKPACNRYCSYRYNHGSNSSSSSSSGSSKDCICSEPGAQGKGTRTTHITASCTAYAVHCIQSAATHHHYTFIYTGHAALLCCASLPITTTQAGKAKELADCYRDNPFEYLTKKAGCQYYFV